MNKNSSLLARRIIILSIFLGLVSFTSKSSPLGKDDFIPADQVFKNEDIEKAIKEADQKPIESDGSVTLRSSAGRYPRKKGTILVTSDKYMGVLPTGHAAIVYSHDRVVEANKLRVEFGKNNWFKNKEQVYGVVVRNLSNTAMQRAADYCRRQLGKPYNYLYYRLDRRDAFYCSHLVYAAHKDLFRIDLNTNANDFTAPSGVRWKAIHPMELVNTHKTRLIYRKK